MRYIALQNFLFVLVFFNVLSCESVKNTSSETNANKVNFTEIKLEKIWMRGNSQLIINQNQIVQNLNEESKSSRELTKEVSTKLGELVSKINLEEMSNWESPTQKRFYDGAKSTKLVISTNGKEYSSQGFDEGEPPAQLKDLYMYLETLNKI